MERAIAGLTGVLLVTTLVLPGRQTPTIFRELFSGGAKLSKAVIGQG